MFTANFEYSLIAFVTFVDVLEQGKINDAADSFARFYTVCDFCFQYLDSNDPADAA